MQAFGSDPLGRARGQAGPLFAGADLIRRMSEKRLRQEFGGVMPRSSIARTFAKSPTKKRQKRIPRFKRSSESLSAVKEYADGREVCRNNEAGRYEYCSRLMCMFVRQWDSEVGYVRCCDCGRRLTWEDATFEHEVPRGLGGAWRDDRIAIFKHGKFIRSINGAAHLYCNSERGSRRTDLWHGNNLVIEA